MYKAVKKAIQPNNTPGELAIAIGQSFFSCNKP